MYPYQLSITKQFLTGNLAGITLTDTFGICDPADYKTEKLVGTVTHPVLLPNSTYRIVAAVITRTIGEEA